MRRFTWADESRHKCAWADAYYQQKKAQGKSHAQSLRCLGQRWLKVIRKMWTTHTLYDEARHMMDLVTHGFWVLGNLPELHPALDH